MLAELRMFARYAGGLGEFFSSSTTLAESRAELATGLECREANFLDTVNCGVWQNPSSPYLPLFRHAGITRGDLEQLVRADGVDSALTTILKAGVSVRIDEFKGKQPITRPNLEHPVTAEDFDNPLIEAHFEGKTGGSGGARRRLLIDLNQIAQDACSHHVYLDSFGIAERPSAVWRAVPPCNSGLKKPLMASRVGVRIDRWFSPFPISWSRDNFKYSLFNAYTWFAARWHGKPFPFAEHVPVEDFSPILDWLEAMTAAGTPAYFDTAASSVVRICAEANSSKRDISGTLFRAGSEPLTPTRNAIIERANTRVAAHYAASETGPIAMACADRDATDDVHVLLNKMAALHHPALDSRSLYLTTISPYSPKLMINVDIGDSAEITFRPCTCGFGQLGFTQHLSHIRSREKLTCSGILLSSTDLAHLIESVLPTAFGGAPTDYQLVEDDLSGLPRVSIVVSPKRGAIEESVVINTVLDAIHDTGAGGRVISNQLRSSGTFSVQRREPYLTPAAKFLPLYVLRNE